MACNVLNTQGYKYMKKYCVILAATMLALGLGACREYDVYSAQIDPIDPPDDPFDKPDDPVDPPDDPVDPPDDPVDPPDDPIDPPDDPVDPFAPACPEYPVNPITVDDTECSFSFDQDSKVVQICSGEDFEKLRNILYSTHYNLTIYIMRDINLADGYSIKEVNGRCSIPSWQSLPGINNTKILTPDGEQRRITSYSGDKRCYLPQALFEEIESSEVHNLSLDFDVKTNDTASALVDYVDSSIIERVVYSGCIESTFVPPPNTFYFAGSGGIAGFAYGYGGKTSRFIQSYCDHASIIAPGIASCGCVVGMAEPDVYFTTAPYTNTVDIISCGSINGSSGVGGLAGYFASSTIENVINEVDSLFGTSWVGGLVGCAQHTEIRNIKSHTNSISVIDSDDLDLSSDFGGLAGYGLNSTIENIDVSTNYISGAGFVGGVFGSIEYAVTLKNIINKVGFMPSNLGVSQKAGGLAGALEIYSPMTFKGITTWLHTTDNDYIPHFAKHITDSDIPYVDGVSPYHQLIIKNMVSTAQTDLNYDINSPIIIGKNAYSDMNVQIDNAWYYTNDPNVNECIDAPFGGSFSQYNDSNIQTALDALNENSEYKWMILHEKFGGETRKFLTFELPPIEPLL